MFVFLYQTYQPIKGKENTAFVFYFPVAKATSDSFLGTYYQLSINQNKSKIFLKARKEAAT